MAKNNKDLKPKDFSKKKKVNDLMDAIRYSIGSIYKNTYITNTTNKDDLSNIKASIDGSIDNIVNNVQSNLGTVSMSKVYNRLMSTEEKKSSINGDVKELEDIFSDKTVTDGFLIDLERNKNIRDYDDDIDILCRYMPMLEDTLDAKRDNVLSADNFNKDYLNVINKSNIKEEASFNERIDRLKNKYNLLEITENIYYKTDKYGETFQYCVPYKQAFNKLLAKKRSKLNTVNESFKFENIKEDASLELKDIDLKDKSINLFIDKSNVLESVVKEYKAIYDNSNLIHESVDKFDDKIIPDDTKFEGLKGSEGLLFDNKSKNIKDEVDVPGTILKDLRRDRIIPVYIEDICLGYYYVETDYDKFQQTISVQNPLMNFRNNKNHISNSNISQKEMFIQRLAKQMSQKIDAAFINNNQDISKELYMILSQEDLFERNVHDLKITFLPADDVIHTYLKLDPETHRGISGLHNSITMAKLYTSIYLTDVTGILTRSQDKRVYYVKQNVDTNISKVLLNTLNQIKKSNMGAREIVSAKNMLNIVGKYNDYVIPVGASGPPIEFEIMQGQDIQIKTDLLDILEQGAINATGVPYEYMQSRKSVDYAVRLTMSNGKFLRKCFKEQSIAEKWYTNIITKLYNNEYNENDEIEVKLPPPSFLSLLNQNQIMENNKQFTQSIIEMECADIEDSALVANITRKVQRYILGTYIDANIFDIIKDAKLEYQANKKDEEN